MDTYNFNTNTYEDYIDYLDFQEYETMTYIYTGEIGRLTNFVNYIQPNIETELRYVSLEDSFAKHHQEGTGKVTFNGEQAIQNGIKALLTGIYPAEFQGTLKHIYVEDACLSADIDHSILAKMAINSSIVAGAGTFPVGVTANYPQILVKLSDYIDSDLFVYLDKEEIDQNVTRFMQIGQASPLPGELVVDYMAIQGIIPSSSLFIHSDGCFLDYRKRLSVSRNVSCSYSEYLLKVSEAHDGDDKWSEKATISHMYYVLANLMRQLQMQRNHVVTPFNAFQFEAQATYKQAFDFIGIEHNGSYYCYSLKENKVYETEADFFSSFRSVL